MKTSHKLIFFLATAVVLLACSTFGLSRDEGGKLMLETNLPLSLVETTIENAVDASQVADLDVELRDGYVFVHAGAVNFGGLSFSNVSFHLELFVIEGRLSAEMTNVTVSGTAIDEVIYAPVNQMIEDKLTESQGQMEMMSRAELVDARVNVEGITLVWRVTSGDGN